MALLGKQGDHEHIKQCQRVYASWLAVTGLICFDFQLQSFLLVPGIMFDSLEALETLFVLFEIPTWDY